jgi:hypothetical protein
MAGSERRPMGHELLLDAPRFTVPADPARRRVTTSEWIAEHLASPGLPRGHGFTQEAARDGRAWYAFDAAALRCLMLDTVNPRTSGSPWPARKAARRTATSSSP